MSASTRETLPNFAVRFLALKSAFKSTPTAERQSGAMNSRCCPPPQPQSRTSLSRKSSRVFGWIHCVKSQRLESESRSHCQAHSSCFCCMRESLLISPGCGKHRRRVGVRVGVGDEVAILAPCVESRVSSISTALR